MTKTPMPVTGMPPTPRRLTRLGAPVDDRFDPPEPASAPAPAAAPEKQEDSAKRRSTKNGDDDPKGPSKRRR